MTIGQITEVLENCQYGLLSEEDAARKIYLLYEKEREELLAKVRGMRKDPVREEFSSAYPPLSRRETLAFNLALSRVESLLTNEESV